MDKHKTKIQSLFGDIQAELKRYGEKHGQAMKDGVETVGGMIEQARLLFLTVSDTMRAE